MMPQFKPPIRNEVKEFLDKKRREQTPEERKRNPNNIQTTMPSGLKKEEYPHSLGTQTIIDAIRSLDGDNDYNVWDTTFINIFTIIRNNLDKTKSDFDVAKSTKNDLNSICLSIYSFLHNKPTSNVPYIVVYFPDYSRLPLIARKKKLSPREERIERISKILLREVNNKAYGDKEMLMDMPIFTVVAGSARVYPYRKLYEYVSAFNSELKDVRKIATRKYVLVSHIALDYYIFNLFNNVRLLECFTGRVKSNKDLGEKVFKEELIPFNECTHLLFGDSTRVEPICKYKAREKYIELAKKQRWLMKNTSEIRSNILMTDPNMGLVLNQVHLFS